MFIKKYIANEILTKIKEKERTINSSKMMLKWIEIEDGKSREYIEYFKIFRKGSNFEHENKKEHIKHIKGS